MASSTALKPGDIAPYFANGLRRSAGNHTVIVDDEQVLYTLHGHVIARRNLNAPPGAGYPPVKLSSCGYKTATTAAALGRIVAEACPGYAFKKWTIIHEKTGTKIPFEDGMLVCPWPYRQALEAQGLKATTGGAVAGDTDVAL